MRWFVWWTHFSLAWLSDGAVDPLPLAYIAEVSGVIDGGGRKQSRLVTLALSIIINPPLSFLPSSSSSSLTLLCVCEKLGLRRRRCRHRAVLGATMK